MKIKRILTAVVLGAIVAVSCLSAVSCKSTAYASPELQEKVGERGAVEE